jgi:hypothetical protein
MELSPSRVERNKIQNIEVFEQRGSLLCDFVIPATLLL